tara:strand:- start:301 stop:624 length:324 start_codon:yes stop_codon:yes gene_type:complete
MFCETVTVLFYVDDLITNQFKGKESLKPIFDKPHAVMSKFGLDIEVAPEKSAVSMHVKQQFSLILQSTKKRIDLGLKFNDKPNDERLEASGSFGAFYTHNVQLIELA